MRRAELSESELAELIDQAAEPGLRVRVATAADGECLIWIGAHACADLAEARSHIAALSSHRSTFAAV